MALKTNVIYLEVEQLSSLMHVFILQILLVKLYLFHTLHIDKALRES